MDLTLDIGPHLTALVRDYFWHVATIICLWVLFGRRRVLQLQAPVPASEPWSPSSAKRAGFTQEQGH